MFLPLVKIFLLYSPGTGLRDVMVAIPGLTVFLPNQPLLNVGSRRIFLCLLISDLVRPVRQWGGHLCFYRAKDRLVEGGDCYWALALTLTLFPVHSYTLTWYSWTYRSKRITKMIHLWIVGHYLLLTHLEHCGEQTVIYSMLLHFCSLWRAAAEYVRVLVHN